MKNKIKNISAIIPVAGFSSRMGAFKPLLSIGGKTVLENSIGLFQVIGLKNIIVVTGYRADDIRLDYGANVQKVYNPAYAEDMFSSIKLGIEHLPEDCEAFFLLPADMPSVNPETIQRLLARFYSSSVKIVYPKYLSHFGHPPLISCELVASILDWDGDGGLRACLNSYKHLATSVEVDDPGIRMDMDYPEDYQRMCAYIGNLRTRFSKAGTT